MLKICLPQFLPSFTHLTGALGEVVQCSFQAALGSQEVDIPKELLCQDGTQVELGGTLQHFKGPGQHHHLLQQVLRGQKEALHFSLKMAVIASKLT